MRSSHLLESGPAAATAAPVPAGSSVPLARLDALAAELDRALGRTVPFAAGTKLVKRLREGVIKPNRHVVGVLSVAAMAPNADPALIVAYGRAVLAACELLAGVEAPASVGQASENEQADDAAVDLLQLQQARNPSCTSTKRTLAQWARRQADRLAALARACEREALSA